MIKKLKNKNIILDIFFIILFIELFMNGSGQFLAIGPLTIRMILFSIALVVSFIFLLSGKKINILYGYMIGYFSIVTIWSTLQGLLNGAEIDLIFEDIKPLLYFLIILPFSVYIDSVEKVILLIKIIKKTTLVMAFVYLSYIVVMRVGYIDFLTIYEILKNDSNEIMFRGFTNSDPWLFYKGFLYLNIGFIFYFSSKKTKNKIISLMILTAILLTYTRGFIVSLALAFIFLYLINLKEKKSFFILITLSIVVFLATPIYFDFIGERTDSDLIRIIQIEQVINKVNLTSFIFGHGFGKGVPIRPVHMEISYLEILHKQGIIGLIFWIFNLFFIILTYIKIKSNQFRYLSAPFLVGTLFIYIQSFTNPFINNSIGMGFLLITMVTLNVLYKNETTNYYCSIQQKN